MLVKAFTCFVLTCDAAKLSIFTRLATRCSSLLLLLPTTLPLLGAAAAADDDDDDEAGGALGEDSAGADAGAADAAVGAATAAGVSEAAPADALNSDIRKDGIGRRYGSANFPIITCDDGIMASCGVWMKK